MRAKSAGTKARGPGWRENRGGGPTLQGRTEEENIRRDYERVIFLALAAHFSYILLFFLYSFPLAALYNVASVTFYLFALRLVKKGRYRTAVCAIHVEVCLFTTVCTLLTGWELGLPLYLLALTSLVYFCPFEHKYIPYLFAAGEAALFAALKLYTTAVPPYYPPPERWAAAGLYIYNAAACFALILYAAFSSGVSARVSRRILQRENETLSQIANYDQLTGLERRAFFLAKLREAGPGPVAVALGDLDDFKRINDTYGHGCGDYILQETAAVMRSVCGRQADICRWGGEEFVFLFRGAAAGEASGRMELLRRAIASRVFHYGGREIRMTMTFGLCACGIPGQQGDAPPDAGRAPDRQVRRAAGGQGALEAGDYEWMIECADRRMYCGKLGGKNCVVDREPREGAAPAPTI